MQKKNILRICRALAQFRPSFMAILIHLSEEDLIFMEKCFQRTLTVSNFYLFFIYKKK